MKELKVGEKVTITLKVVEKQEGCNGCFFDQGENIPCTYNYKCNRCTRSDHKYVYKELGRINFEECRKCGRIKNYIG